MESEIPEWKKQYEQRKAAAKERARRIATSLKLDFEADRSLTSPDRYLIYIELAEEFGSLARREGRLV